MPGFEPFSLRAATPETAFAGAEPKAAKNITLRTSHWTMDETKRR